MNKATFLAVQLNVEDVATSSGLVELLNTHLVFAADVAEAADALVQLASIARLSSGVEASVELPAVALERLRDRLDGNGLAARRPLTSVSLVCLVASEPVARRSGA